MKLLIAFALVLTTVYAFNPRSKDTPITGRIVNGIDAYPDQFPYMVEIHIPPEDICAGSLIGRTWILTAAHCVYDVSSVQVYLGSHLTNDGIVSYTVEAANFIVHPSWYTANPSDIALLRIPRTDLCDGFIATVALPKIAPSYSTYAGQRALISGWGVMIEPETFPTRLQWAPVPIISNEACSNTVFGLRSDLLCVSTSNHVSPCVGDSGSPLVLRTGEQIGILCRGSLNGCESGEPAVFLRVTSYLDWIKTITGISY